MQCCKRYLVFVLNGWENSCGLIKQCYFLSRLRGGVRLFVNSAYLLAEETFPPSIDEPSNPTSSVTKQKRAGFGRKKQEIKLKSLEAQELRNGSQHAPFMGIDLSQYWDHNGEASKAKDSSISQTKDKDLVDPASLVPNAQQSFTSALLNKCRNTRKLSRVDDFSSSVMSSSESSKGGHLSAGSVINENILEPWEECNISRPSTPDSLDHVGSIRSTLHSPSPLSNVPTVPNFQRSQPLNHIDDRGQPVMVDVSAKRLTLRTAEARGVIIVSDEIFEAVTHDRIAKGNVQSVAELAGIMAAKHTHSLIPLCHNIPLSSVKVSVTPDPDGAERTRSSKARGVDAKGSFTISAKVKCYGATGCEMEALTAVSIAALTIYDMCKAVSHKMEIGPICLVRKSGGKRDVEEDGSGDVPKVEPNWGDYDLLD